MPVKSTAARKRLVARSKILFSLFRAAPEAKAVFGFQPSQDVENHPMLRMGVLVHGARIVTMLDVVLSLLGPDIESFEEVLAQVGQRHVRMGVKKEHFCLLGDSIREVIASIIGDEFTDEDDEAWKEVFVLVTGTILMSM